MASNLWRGFNNFNELQQNGYELMINFNNIITNRENYLIIVSDRNFINGNS